MIDSKNAWLIGLYTVDIEARIESLGYKLTRLFTNLQQQALGDEPPSLIVFSNGHFNDIKSMYAAKDFFPQTLLISLPVRIESVQNAFDYPMEKEPGPSMTRLITSIKEREYRWDN